MSQSGYVLDIESLLVQWGLAGHRKQEVPDNEVNKPTHLFRYPGGFRMGKKCQAVRVEADYFVAVEFSRGAHP